MPNRYPQEAALRDGRRVLIRPFAEPDAGRLHEFFMRLPEEQRRFAWDRIADASTVEGWARNIDYGKALPLLALDGAKVVADATLHRRKGGPLRLVGRIKWLVDPEYRGVGLGTLLVNHFITIGRENGLRFLGCFLISDLEADAIKTLVELGFTRYEIPGYGTDPDGGQHDMTKLVLKL
ncbi:MAG TPA: GNAT family N-acetyltransferase [Thermoanaerobaculia bacterium]|nr:GNAT family N-acetyltransferase [Thermoanaerobaculia bacterium]